jgi:hypothetical protein
MTGPRRSASNRDSAHLMIRTLTYIGVSGVGILSYTLPSGTIPVNANSQKLVTPAARFRDRFVGQLTYLMSSFCPTRSIPVTP